ncbi:MAG: PEP-CTERM sorting domain-containing protein [Planctomycetia bacterium]|nr:PEP-CTERM sorting domain-containing protein [Planctomycetia bacterium]
MRFFKNSTCWMILWLALLSGNSLWAIGYTWKGGNSGDSLLPIAGETGSHWVKNGYGPNQFFLGYSDDSGTISATLGQGEVFDTRKGVTTWPEIDSINNGSFCIGRWNNLQSTLTLSGNAQMYTGTNFWVMYGQNASETTFASTIGTLNMSGTSSLWVEDQFNIAGQNFNQGKVYLLGSAKIDANSVMTQVGGTQTDVEMVLSGESSIATRSGAFYLRGTKNRTTLNDSATMVAGAAMNISGSDTDVTLNNSSAVTVGGTMTISGSDTDVTLNNSSAITVGSAMTISGSDTVVAWKDLSQTKITGNLTVGNTAKDNVTLQLSGNAQVIANGTGEYYLARGENSTVKVEISDSATWVLGMNGVPSNTKPRMADGLNSSFTLVQSGGQSVLYGRICLGEGESAYSNGSYQSTTNVDLSGGTMTTNALIVGSRASTEVNLSGTGVFNNWGRFVINYYNVTEKAGIFNQTGGTANIWANNSYWPNTNAVGITFGAVDLQKTIHPGQYNISGGSLHTYAVRNFNAYTTDSIAADDQLFNISGTAEVHIIAQDGVTGSGVLAVPTSMTGGTLNVKEIQTANMANGTFLQQGGTLSPDGGTAITPTTYANTNAGKETYEIAELMGFEKGEESFTTQIVGNYTITSLDSAISRAEIRLEQDVAGNYDLIDVSGVMNIGEDVLLSIYLSENSPEGFFPLITAEEGIFGEFAELQVFDYLGNLLNRDVNSLIYNGNAVIFANVPEPATWGMLLLGIFFLAGKKWYSGRKK